MSGSTIIESPEIPLVDKVNGRFSRYVENSNSALNESQIRRDAPDVTNRCQIILLKQYRRKLLTSRRRMIVNVKFSLAVLGIILMLVENECVIRKVFTKADPESIILKGVLSLSTAVLLVAIVLYHVTCIQLKLTENNWGDWRLVLRFPMSYLKILLELIVCGIHPIPGNITVSSYDVDNRHRLVSVDAILSILMFARLYILGTFIVVHHPLFIDTSSLSIDALKRVKINTVFVFKSLMSTMPGTILITAMLAILIINSWALRTCEVYYHPGIPGRGYINCMWLTSITFFTVGYGDIYPTTYCGRFVSIITASVGVGATALLVAVLEQKLEQTRPQRHVHNFVSMVHLDTIRKHAASDVIKNTFRLWTMKCQGISTGYRRTRIHGKLLKAIYGMKEAVNERIAIGEGSVGIIEVSRSVNALKKSVAKLKDGHNNILSTTKCVQKKIDSIEQKLDLLISQQ